MNFSYDVYKYISIVRYYFKVGWDYITTIDKESYLIIQRFFPLYEGFEVEHYFF